MKFFSKLNWSKTKKSLLTAVLLVASVAGGALAYGTYADNKIDAASCPSNDIMPCGVLYEKDPKNAFIDRLNKSVYTPSSANPADMDNIYGERYGLPHSEYANFRNYAKAGKINPDTGNITVDGITVGYDAQSLGRNSKSVSHPVTIGGKTYHESPIRLLTKYTNEALVLFDAKGNVQTVIMNLCGNPMTVTKKDPKYNCDALNMTQVDRDTFKFSSNISTSNGATVTKVVYDFGDGQTVTQTSPSTVVEHTYAKAGNYVAKVTAYVKAPFSRGEFPITVTANCQKPLTVNEEAKPSINITKTVDGVERKEVALNTEFKYNLKVTNTGNVDLKNVVVSDQAPANVVFISTDKGSIVNNALSYSIPSLAKGSSVTINITAKLTKYVAGDIKNTACVETPTIPGTNPDDCDDAIITTPAPKTPGVKIEKYVHPAGEVTDTALHESLVVNLNTPFLYRLYVTNSGEVDLKNVAIKDSAPSGIQFISAKNTSDGTTISVADNKIDYKIPSLPVNKTVMIEITAKATAYSATPVKNTACVDAPEVNGNPDDCDDATTTTPEPKVSIDKTVNGGETAQVKVGEEFTYKLVVKNIGQVDLKNVKVSDTQPAGIQFVRADKGQFIGNATTTSYDYTIPSLKVGESVTINITAKATKSSATPVKNTACVDAPEIPGTKDDCDDATTTTPEPGKVSVCDPETRNIIQVPETDKDKYLPVDSPKCEKIEVCIKDSGDTTLKPIYKDEFDASKHSTNPNDCKKPETPAPEEPTPPKPEPETPAIIPATGPEIIGGLAGTSALSYGAYTYLASRRAIRNVRK